MEDSSLNDPNSILIRLNQIETGGKVVITHDDITVFYKLSLNLSSFAKSTNTYKRIITYSELTSLKSAIELSKQSASNQDQLHHQENNANNNIQSNIRISNYINDDDTDFKNNIKNNPYEKFNIFFNIAKELRENIQKMDKFGKTFIYESDYVFDIIDDNPNKFYLLVKKMNRYSNKLFNLISKFNNALSEESYRIPYLSVSNLLYFGSLIQRGNTDDQIEYLLLKLFHFNQRFDKEKKEALLEAKKDEYKFDPVKCAHKMFSYILKKNGSPKIMLSFYQSPSFSIKSDEINQMNQTSLYQKLKLHFMSNTFAILKVDLPVMTLHALRLASILLYDENDHSPCFFENFYCYEDSDIRTYFSDWKEHIFIRYCFIIHPEMLPPEGKSALREQITSRMISNPEDYVQKFVVITSSDEFDLENDVFNVNNNVKDWLESINSTGSFYFTFRIFQSKKAGSGKTTYIRKEIDKIKMTKKVKEFRYFITDANQTIPAESLVVTPETTNVIHLQFNDKIFETGIKFWSYLSQLYFNGFVFSRDGAPLTIASKEHIVILFEIPQTREEGETFKNLFEFPISISSKFLKIEDTIIDNKLKMIDYPNNEYYDSGLKCVKYYINNKEVKERIKDLRSYIIEMHKLFFKSSELDLSLRKLGMIRKYLTKYTKLYINSLQKEQEPVLIDTKRFTLFFYSLTISSFYTYSCLPCESRNGLTFLIVDNLFCDHVSQSEKRFCFYTIKKCQDFFSDLSILNGLTKDQFEYEKYHDFSFKFEQLVDSSFSPQEILRNCFCSSDTYKNYVDNFREKNPQSFMAITKMTLPTLFRSSVILSHVFLTQPIILKGDTGCGKTSTLKLLFEYFNIPYNDEKYSLSIEVGKIFDCYGGVTIEDIQKNISEVPKSSKKHIIFLDEINTTNVSSYIENLFLDGINNHQNPKIAFIGALNPCIKKNKISSLLTKVGLTQNIKGEDKKFNILDNLPTEKPTEFISEMMYHVNENQKSTEDIIFDFNPIYYDQNPSEDEKFYPEEERKSIHEIIKSISKNNVDDKIYKLFDTCITFIRRLMNERALISYRDVIRAMNIYNYLIDYYTKNKDMQILKKRDIEKIDISLLAVIVSFVLRLPNLQIVKLSDLNESEQETFNKVFEDFFKDRNYGELNEETQEYTLHIRDNLLSLLWSEIGISIDDIKKKLMKFVYQYNLIYLQKPEVWKFSSTFIHLFVMDICIKCKLPCFIIGMPGTSKSFAIELLKEIYKDKLYVSTYMSSRTSSPDGIKSHYYDAVYKQIINEQKGLKDCYSVVFIDEMGNANINPSRPLKFLHGILDHGIVLNETGYSVQTATIGVSNYTMDFANMNRGVLIYTDLPSLDEIKKVFSYENKNKKISNALDFINIFEDPQQNSDEEINKIFDNLWPSGKPPTNIALRSVYNIRYLINKEEYDVHDVCRILRELYNSKNLELEGYENLIEQCPKNVKEAIKDKEYKDYSNMACFFERILDQNTKSHKSLSILTKNYEAFEYINLFEDHEFVNYTRKNFFELFQTHSYNFRHTIFAEDFKEDPESLSYDALEKITECISINVKNTDNNLFKILFVGNNPCFDSCLDLLNVPDSEKKSNTREVILGSGFSSRFVLNNEKFFITLIANKDDLKDSDNRDNPISSAFRDRMETIYLDWKIIGPYYLSFFFNINDLNETGRICEEISVELEKHITYDSKDPDFLHLYVPNLLEYLNKYKGSSLNKHLVELLKKRWKKGVKAVILTKSHLLEKILLPENIDYLLIADSDIQNTEQLNGKITVFLNKNNNERLIIFKCSDFDKLHFVHLKHIFDQKVISQSENIVHILIIYYGRDPKEFSGLSSFKWPILSMEDISVHEELKVIDQNMKRDLTNDEVDSLIEVLKDMTKQDKLSICSNMFKSLFHRIFTYTKKSYENIKYAEKELNEYEEKANLFDEFKQSITSFDINIKEDSLILSKKSQIINKVYSKLCQRFKSFIIFGFTEHTNASFREFLLKCTQNSCLDTALTLFEAKGQQNPFIYLFYDYFDYLSCNSALFDENMKKLRFIAEGSFNCFKKISFDNPKEGVIALTLLELQSKYCGSMVERICGLSVNFFEILYNQDKESEVNIQIILDCCHLRSIAGMNLLLYNTDYFCDVYLANSLIPRSVEKSEEKSEIKSEIKSEKKSEIKSEKNKITIKYNNKPECTIEDDKSNGIIDKVKDKMIIEFQKKSIFEIFKLPVKTDNPDNEVFKLIQKVMGNEIEDQNSDEELKIYNKICFEANSLKGDDLTNLIKTEIEKSTLQPQEKSSIVACLYSYHALNAWQTNTNKDLANIIESIYNEDYSIAIFDKNLNILEVNPNDETLKPFGNIWNSKYRSLEWFSSNECLIDEIQKFIVKGTEINSNFENWFFSGLETREPLSVIALRRYFNNPTAETKKDLAKVIDPFFGNPKLVDYFISENQEEIRNSINNKDKHHVELKSITAESNRIFKLQENNNKLIEITLDRQYPAYFVWNSIAFCQPSKYSLLHVALKSSTFFMHFKVVPKIINTVLHLRHIFSYTPIITPIILFCTTLFENVTCPLNLYDLGCFKEYPEKEELQNELKTFADFLKGSEYSEAFQNVYEKSAYSQIKFILDIYYPKYNEISCRIYKIMNSRISNIPSVEKSHVIPCLLLQNFTLKDIIYPSVFISKDVSNKKLQHIFKTQVFTDGENPNSLPLFKVITDSEKDFIGFSQSEYRQMFSNALIPNVSKDTLDADVFEDCPDDQKKRLFYSSVLSLFLSFYSVDDENNNNFDISAYDFENSHLNTYVTENIRNQICLELPKFNDEEDEGNNIDNSDLFVYVNGVNYSLQEIMDYIPNDLKQYISDNIHSAANIRLFP